MFKCGVCQKSSDLGEPATSVVLERRNKNYDVFNKLGEFLRSTVGWEIVREAKVHVKCAYQAVAQPSKVNVNLHTDTVVDPSWPGKKQAITRTLKALKKVGMSPELLAKLA